MARFHDEYPEHEEMLGNFTKARSWHLPNIKSKKIRNLVKGIINATEKYGVWIYHISQYDSVYLKFKDQKMGSVRIADYPI